MLFYNLQDICAAYKVNLQKVYCLKVLFSHITSNTDGKTHSELFRTDSDHIDGKYPTNRFSNCY